MSRNGRRLACPRCSRLASPRGGLGPSAYQVWRCRNCRALFDEHGRTPPPPMTAEQGEAVVQIQLGLRVRDLREGLGWNLRELAVAAGVSRAYLGEIEAGEANPSLHKLVQIAAALRVDVGGLTRGLKPVAPKGRAQK